jgi:hypothetical protein
MGLFNLFGKTAKQTEEEAAAERARRMDLEVYSGMRVEVTSTDGRMFLVARLAGLRGDRAQLKLNTEAVLMASSEDPVPVTLRGYSSRENRAVFLRGTVRLGAGGVWLVEHLTLVKRNDDRIHLRAVTDREGVISPLVRPGGAEEPCRLLNISVGGVCLGLEKRYDVGDKFLLRVRLTPEGEFLALRCQMLRILERRHGYFEYGCRFSELEAANEERILRYIFAVQER